MKVLLINKFLYPCGGTETYIFKLGEYFSKHGHKVEYFGMFDERNIVGNQKKSYTGNVDYHTKSLLKSVSYSLKTIYSADARRKIRAVLDEFEPDVCHLNNFNYQLTPSVILEIVAWRKESGRKCKIVFTAHDYNLICPNHQMSNPCKHEVCEKCVGGHFINCLKGKCIHGSLAKSAVGTMEAFFWNISGVYSNIDTIICCSKFMKTDRKSVV